MNYAETEKLLENERKILAMHQENLNLFIEQGVRGFLDEQTLQAMLLKGEPISEKHTQEFNRLISAVTASGRKIAELNMALKNIVISNKQT